MQGDAVWRQGGFAHDWAVLPVRDHSSAQRDAATLSQLVASQHVNRPTF